MSLQANPIARRSLQEDALSESAILHDLASIELEYCCERLNCPWMWLCAHKRLKFADSAMLDLNMSHSFFPVHCPTQVVLMSQD